MAIVVKYEVTGMEQSRYDQVIRELAAVGQAHPDGRLYHLCYGDRERLQVIDVFESPAKLEAFGAKLMPILVRCGIQARPDVLGETHNLITGPAAPR